MLSKILSMLVATVAGWWAWTGPIHDWQTISVKEQAEANAQQMARCLYGKEYVASATGNGAIDPEAACARQLNLYRHEGQWFSYSQARKSAGSGS